MCSEVQKTKKEKVNDGRCIEGRSNETAERLILYVYVCVFILIYVCVRACMYLYVHVCACVCVYVYVHVSVSVSPSMGFHRIDLETEPAALWISLNLHINNGINE